MKILCDICKLEYEEINDNSIFLCENGCSMICRECSNKNYESQGWKIQPERSKREDLVRLHLCCPLCGYTWDQDMDMMDETDGISPCLKCGYN